MKYLIALILPPLAILFCGRPISAILNLALIIIGFLTVYVFSIFGLVAIPFAFMGAVIHAILVVSKTSADERQRELIIAMGGKLPPRKNWELDAAAGLMALVLLAAVIGIILNPQSAVIKIPAPATKAQTVSAPPQPSQTLPILEGWTMAEVVAKFGEPSAKAHDTGWALWPTFRARFVAGKVTEVVQSDSH